MLFPRPGAVVLATLSLAAPATSSPSIVPPHGIVYYAPEAAGASALDLLDTPFVLVPIRSWAAHRPFPPAARGFVVHVSDLLDDSVVAALQRAYDEGLTVGIVDASLADAEVFRQMVGRDYPVDFDPAEVLPFLGLREQRSNGRRIHRTHLLLARDTSVPGTPEGMAEADASESDWLRAAFTDLPDEVPASEGTTPTDCLTELADSYLNDTVKSDSDGDSFQCVNNTWATRSFTQSDDLYYVRQTLTTKVGTEEDITGVVIAVTMATNALTDPATAPIILQNSPGETQNTTTYTSGVNYGIGGSAGYKVDPVYLVSPSMEITDSTMTTVDPTNVNNETDPASGMTIWAYGTNCGNNCTLNGKSYSYTDNWIWAVPFSDYSASQTSVSYMSTAESSYILAGESKELCFALTSVIPFPFNETSLVAPTVSSVNPTSASQGDTITIQGTNFYLIEAVIIGGHSVPSDNYEVTQPNTTMSLIIPSDQPNGANQSVVVRNGIGPSTDDVTITIN